MDKYGACLPQDEDPKIFKGVIYCSIPCSEGHKHSCPHALVPAFGQGNRCKCTLKVPVTIKPRNPKFGYTGCMCQVID